MNKYHTVATFPKNRLILNIGILSEHIIHFVYTHKKTVNSEVFFQKSDAKCKASEEYKEAPIFRYNGTRTYERYEVDR